MTRLPLARLSIKLSPKEKRDTHVHLPFFLLLKSSTGCSGSPVLPRVLLGNRGLMMKVLSAPRLTLAMTRLFRLSECRLSFSYDSQKAKHNHPIYTLPSS